MSKKTWLVVIVCLLLIGGIAYYATNPNGNPAGDNSPAGNFQGRMRPNLPAGSQAFFGTISAVSGSDLTVDSRGRNGTTTIAVSIDDNTQFAGGTKDSLAVGTRISGVGSTTPAGVTASRIQINPTRPSGMGRGNGRFGRQQGAPSQAPAN